MVLGVCPSSFPPSFRPPDCLAHAMPYRSPILLLLMILLMMMMMMMMMMQMMMAKAVPVALVDGEGGRRRLWYKHDNVFKQPKTFFQIQLLTPVQQQQHIPYRMK
jgi:hypothetical protein